MIVHQHDTENYYVCPCDDHGGPMPHNCVKLAPPARPWGKSWYQWTGKEWQKVEDHRERRTDGGFLPEDVQSATDYWLPSAGDTYQSSARHMTAIGPLPAGATLTPPAPTLDECKTQKRQAFAQTFTTLEQRAQRPQSTVLAALMDDTPAPEPDADFIWQLEAIKAENRLLLAQLEAADTQEAVASITPWLPQESPVTASTGLTDGVGAALR